MPQALAFAIPAVFGAGGLTLAGSLVSLGLSLGASLLLRKTPEEIKPENIRINTKASTAQRIAHVGQVRVGCNIVFHRASGGTSYRVCVHGHGEISEVLAYYMDGDETPLDGSGWVDTSHDYYVVNNRGVGLVGMTQVQSRTGQVPETHYSDITALWPEWTSNHRLDGQWTSLIVCRSVSASKQQKVYPRGEPTLEAMAKTAEVYDPRTDTTAYSDNLALIINHYIGHADGLNRPTALDTDDLEAAADECDVLKALAGGGTEPQFRGSGSYSLNEKPQAVLARMMTAGGARIRLKPSGKFGLRMGTWVAPTVTIGFDDIVEVQDVEGGPDILDRFNMLPARFVSRDLGCVEVDADPWVDQDRIDADGEILLGDALDVLMSPSHRQTRAVMKLETERRNPALTTTIVVKPGAGVQAVYEHNITLDLDAFGLSGSYEVTGHRIVFDRGNIASVVLNLRQVDTAAFSLGIDEQGIVQQLPADTAQPTVGAPQNVTATGGGIKVAAETWAAGITVGWDDPGNDAATPVVTYRLSAALPSGATYGAPSITLEPGDTEAQIGPLLDGVDYDIDVAFMRGDKQLGPITTVGNVTALAAADPPAAATGLAVSDETGGVARITFTTSATETLWKTEVLRDSVVIQTEYWRPGESITLDDACGAGTFDWEVRSYNASQIANTANAGPVSQTIT
ncbi:MULTISPECIES: hypothetical protein [unclassified Marinovum]|uniref:hypothetical protein n=1 Tax=unclassified Marinovum TaxID=2647166 RepID=UPI003EDB753A